MGWWEGVLLWASVLDFTKRRAEAGAGARARGLGLTLVLHDWREDLAGDLASAAAADWSHGAGATSWAEGDGRRLGSGRGDRDSGGSRGNGDGRSWGVDGGWDLGGGWGGLGGGGWEGLAVAVAVEGPGGRAEAWCRCGLRKRHFDNGRSWEGVSKRS